MKTRTLIIIVIAVLIVVLLLNFTLTLSPFGSEHCPGLELRKSLGLENPTAACL